MASSTSKQLKAALAKVQDPLFEGHRRARLRQGGCWRRRQGDASSCCCRRRRIRTRRARRGGDRGGAQAKPARRRRRSTIDAEVTHAARQAGRRSAAGREEHHRGGGGQGRRRQVDGRDEPGAGAAAHGATVGLLDADVYGPSVPTMLGEPDVPAGAAAGQEDHPGGALGNQGHVGRLLRRARGRGGVARADGAQAAPAVPRGRRLGRRSITWSSICRPAPATRSSRSRSSSRSPAR